MHRFRTGRRMLCGRGSLQNAALTRSNSMKQQQAIWATSRTESPTGKAYTQIVQPGFRLPRKRPFGSSIWRSLKIQRSSSSQSMRDSLCSPVSNSALLLGSGMSFRKARPCPACLSLVEGSRTKGEESRSLSTAIPAR